jgi:hypothetical protein
VPPEIGGREDVDVKRAVDLVAPRARFEVEHEGASEVQREIIARPLFRGAD